MRIAANHRVRHDLANLPNYFDSKGSALDAVCKVLYDHNLRSDCAGLPGDEGYATWNIRPYPAGHVFCDKCAALVDSEGCDNCLVIAHYTMPSGRIELTVYVS
jgi:hypothetical protein